MIVGYINSNKKNVDVVTQRQVISDYAKINGLIIDAFYTYDNVSQLAESFQTGGHTILFANIVSLGETLAQVKDNLRILLAKGLKIISIKENLFLIPNENVEILLKGLEYAVEIMKSMTSVVAKQALANKKEQGYRLGRKIGSINKKFIWSGKEDEIKRKLLAGVTRKQVAKDTGMSIFSLYNYINQTPELKQALKDLRNV